jgi:Ankyrin repeats (3 copies)
MKNKKGLHPLHTACHVIRPSSVDSNGHDNIDCIDVIDEILLALLSAYPDACKEKHSSTGLYPLHMACRSNQSYTVIKAIYKAYPQAIYEYSNSDGKNLPIHYACQNIVQQTSTDVLQFLLQKHPESITKRSLKDKILPMELAVAAASRCMHNFLLLQQYSNHQEQEQRQYDASATSTPDKRVGRQTNGSLVAGNISTIQAAHRSARDNLPAHIIESEQRNLK